LNEHLAHPKRRRILAEARATLERLNAEQYRVDAAAFDEAEEETPERPWPTRRDFLDPMTRSGAPMQRWHEQGEAFKRACEEEREARRQREAEIVRAYQQKAAAEHETFSQNQIEILGGVIAEIRAQLRDEIQTAVGELRAELTIARTSITRDGATREVIDLPAGWWRRPDAA
jgi:hypothetical protein